MKPVRPVNLKLPVEILQEARGHLVEAGRGRELRRQDAAKSIARGRETVDRIGQKMAMRHRPHSAGSSAWIAAERAFVAYDRYRQLTPTAAERQLREQIAQLVQKDCGALMKQQHELFCQAPAVAAKQ